MKHKKLILSMLLLSGLFTGAEAEPLYQEKYRPQFHFSPDQQWMNDPNGMVYYQGEYHLFYQYNPYANKWGPMHWGHTVSKDMVHWRQMPVALYPDRLGTIFSGSAVADVNNTSGLGTAENPPLVAIYTYHDHLQENYYKAGFGDEYIRHQNQGIAYSLDNGRNWTKYDKNPVLKNPDIADFRDPKVSWYEPENKWVMALAVQSKISFYSSPNLIDWTHESDFGTDKGSHGGVWECPDLIRVKIEGEDQNKWVLLVSIHPGGPNGGSTTQYFVGDFDGRTFTLDESLQDKLTRVEAVFPKGQVFDDFEGELQWQVTGDAIGLVDVEKSHFSSKAMGDKMLSSSRGDDSATGTADSEEFTIQQPYINFFIGGGAYPANASFQLVVNDQVVREQKGESTKGLSVAGWDVSEFQGDKAHFRLVDDATVPFSRISVDNILFSDQPASPYVEHALWMDYGTDNYAGVTWSNIPADDGRILFIGWANNWLYANDIPTERWRSITTLPRELTLLKADDGYRLKSAPVRELAGLRADTKKLKNASVAKEINLTKKLDLDSSLIELQLDLETGDAGVIDLSLANGRGEKTTFSIDRAAGQYRLDRSQSGNVTFSPVVPLVAKAPMNGNPDSLTLSVYLDQSIIEIFVNGGETVLTSQIFPNEPYTQVTLAADKPIKIRSAAGSDLKSIWPKQ